MTAILARRVQVRIWIDAVADVRRRRGDCLLIEILARERCFRGLRAIRFRADAGYADLRRFARAVIIESELDRHADHGETRRGMRHFLIGLAKPPRRFLNADLAQDLAGL